MVVEVVDRCRTLTRSLAYVLGRDVAHVLHTSAVPLLLAQGQLLDILLGHCRVGMPS